MERRRFLTGVGLVTAGGAAGFAASVPAEQAMAREGPTARTGHLTGRGAYVATVTFRTAPQDKLVALTIDDGPTREWTPQVLSIFRRHDVQGTFFVVGERARDAPRWVQRAAAAGHELANHTWKHSDLTQHGEAFDRDSLERTHELVTKLTRQEPALCRPPYGRIDSVGLAVCAGLHYQVMLWSEHVTGSNAQHDVDVTLRDVSPGSIVLAHDGGPEPNPTLMKQLDRMVGSMKDSGYRFVTVSQLLTAAA